ncbi:hypothetical protein V8E36_005209 [Tilletia maclaganii]
MEQPLADILKQIMARLDRLEASDPAQRALTINLKGSTITVTDQSEPGVDNTEILSSKALRQQEQMTVERIDSSPCARLLIPLDGITDIGRLCCDNYVVGDPAFFPIIDRWGFELLHFLHKYWLAAEHLLMLDPFAEAPQDNDLKFSSPRYSLQLDEELADIVVYALKGASGSSLFKVCHGEGYRRGSFYFRAIMLHFKSQGYKPNWDALRRAQDSVPIKVRLTVPHNVSLSTVPHMTSLPYLAQPSSDGDIPVAPSSTSIFRPRCWNYSKVQKG